MFEARAKKITSERDLRIAAMHFLARREYSAGELRTKLTRACEDVLLIEACLSTLQADGLQSDSRFVKAYVRARVERGFGPLRLVQDLAQKQVADELVNEALNKDDQVWLDRARVVRSKRFGVALPVEATEKAKQMRFLQYRGFEAGQCRAAVERF